MVSPRAQLLGEVRVMRDASNSEISFHSGIRPSAEIFGELMICEIVLFESDEQIDSGYKPATMYLLEEVDIQDCALIGLFFGNRKVMEFRLKADVEKKLNG